MIETFDPGAVHPRSSRKHRRLDDILLDGGGDTRSVGPLPPSSYGHAQESCPVLFPTPISVDPLMEQGPVNQSKVSHIVPTVATNQDDGVVGSFGPWMVAERRPRRNTRVQFVPKVNTSTLVQGSRFNPIFTSNMDKELAFPTGNNMVPPKASVPSLHQTRKTTAPSNLEANAKMKMISTGKMPKVIPLRKPMTVNLSDFLVQSRFSAKASSSKQAASHETLLDSTRHSTTTMKENDDPNIVHNEDSWQESRLSYFFTGFLNSHRVEANGFAGGIWVAWYDTISITIAFTHIQFIHFRIINKRDRSSILVTAVYAFPSAPGKKFLWPHLSRLASSIRSPWVMFGDFNATLSPADRQGCAPSTRPNKAFQNLIFDNGLRDMGFHGPEFTWSRGAVSVRPDRFICNSYFDEAFPVAMVRHLLRMRSDHRPILLQIGNVSRQSGATPFRYFSGWLSHEDFSRMVEDN
ncbi:hypothetical protein V6N13_100213 [Hibiscus sabdariffa]